MDPISRPFRSVLYIPAANERALAKAATLRTDAIIFDLEDAVAPDAKVSARATLTATLPKTDYGARFLLVRINGFDTPWGAEDLSAMSALRPDAILLPKVETLEQITRAEDALNAAGATDTQVWAMMETPKGILAANTLAAHPALCGFVLGTNDLIKDLRVPVRADRMALMTSLQTCVLAARAHALVCVDGVYNAFRDEDGLIAECEQGRDLGMDGKSLIHPAQLPQTNQIFAPDSAALDQAQKQIDAFQNAQNDGSGIAVLDGRIVENLHVEAAKRLLVKAEAIKRLESE